MEIITYVLIGFGIVSAVDRIIGNKLGLGAEFEKGIMMLGPLTLSMAGMIILVPVISSALEGIAYCFPPFLDFSILPSSLIANDMGGAHLAVSLSSNEAMGLYNGLVISSMMGCTVSFIIPFSLQVTDKKLHGDILLGILLGIITIPFGCIVSGIMLGIPFLSLMLNLIPLIIFAGIIALGLLKFKKITIKIFSVLGWSIKLIITVGLILGIIEFLTGYSVIKGADSLIEAMKVIINIVCIMTGAFPLLYLLKKLLRNPLKLAGRKMGINETSAFGFLSTLGTSVTTFEMADKMDRKGLILNSAFAVSGSFVFVDHLAFTLSFNAAYVPSVIIGKLVSGALAVLLAVLFYRKNKKEVIYETEY